MKLFASEIVRKYKFEPNEVTNLLNQNKEKLEKAITNSTLLFNRYSNKIQTVLNKYNITLDGDECKLIKACTGYDDELDSKNELQSIVSEIMEKIEMPLIHGANFPSEYAIKFNVPPIIGVPLPYNSIYEISKKINDEIEKITDGCILTNFTPNHFINGSYKVNTVTVEIFQNKLYGIEKKMTDGIEMILTDYPSLVVESYSLPANVVRFINKDMEMPFDIKYAMSLLMNSRFYFGDDVKIYYCGMEINNERK